MIGVTSVCMSAASSPAAASVATIARSLRTVESRRRWRGVSEPESPSVLIPPAYAGRGCTQFRMNCFVVALSMSPTETARW